MPLGSGLTITIKIDGEKMDRVSPKQLEPMEVKPEPVVEEKTAKVDKDIERGDMLDLELIKKDRMTDDEKAELAERLVLYVQDMIKKNRPGVVRQFMDKAKHHLEDFMLEMIKDELRLSKVKL